MKILVCIRQGLDGEINPFDACAYEEALKFLNINEILLKNEVLLTDMLFTTYFQIGNCYHALNKIQKAHGYYALCFESLDGNDPLLHEMQRMLNY